VGEEGGAAEGAPEGENTSFPLSRYAGRGRG
jgi:hypothetical protein